ncbi:unnamed protein product, partial [Prorocentrum cordatum]
CDAAVASFSAGARLCWFRRGGAHQKELGRDDDGQDRLRQVLCPMVWPLQEDEARLGQADGRVRGLQDHHSGRRGLHRCGQGALQGPQREGLSHHQARGPHGARRHGRVPRRAHLQCDKQVCSGPQAAVHPEDPRALPARGQGVPAVHPAPLRRRDRQQVGGDQGQGEGRRGGRGGQDLGLREAPEAGGVVRGGGANASPGEAGAV